MSDRGWLPRGPVPTAITIAAIAAITAGLLHLAGVGQSEAPESREERIDRTAAQIVEIVLATSPESCDLIRQGEILEIILDSPDLKSLRPWRHNERLAVQTRSDEKLQEACLKQDR